MAYIIKINQLGSYIQALVLLCYILMVFLCPSNDLSFMFSMALPLSKSVYLTLLSLGTCPGQKSVGEWNNELLGGFPHSCCTHGCIGTVKLLLFHFRHGSLDILPEARLGGLGVAPSVAGDLEVIARTAISIAFKRSCMPGPGSPCWAHSLVE